MEPFEVFGWVAALLTFLTYYQKVMLRLRILGIFANLCFIIWSLAFGVYPTLTLHLALLPMNLYRLLQIVRMKREAAMARADTTSPLHWLRNLADPMVYQDGDYVFQKGDPPDRLYYVVSGSVALEGLEKRVDSGELLGEVAFFTSKQQRTASARCEGRCEVLALNAADLATLSLQHPAFNFYIMRVIAERLASWTPQSDPQPATVDRTPV